MPVKISRPCANGLRSWTEKSLARSSSIKLDQLLTKLAALATRPPRCSLPNSETRNALRALAAYVGVCPAHKHAGKHQPRSSSLSPVGNRRLRHALWMPTLATQSNPWLMAFYRRLIDRGKPHKVALCAARRKLVAAIYSVAKHRRPFSSNLNPQSAVRVRYENA